MSNENCCNVELTLSESPIVELDALGSSYIGELPTMSTVQKGGAKVGAGLEVDSDEFLNIAPSGVVSSMIDNSAVTTSKLADGAVTSAKVADESITPAKLSGSVIDMFDGNVKSFDTVAGMQTASNLQAGDICHTNGFHAAGDGGAAFYKITYSGTPNGMNVISCNNLIANFLIIGDFVTPEMFGAKGDGVTDDSAFIKKAIDIAYVRGIKVMIGRKTHRIASSILIDRPINVEGFSSRESIIKCDDCDGFVMSGQADAFITGVYIKHLKFVQTTLAVGTWPTFSGQSHKGVYVQCLNSIIEDVICIGFEYGIWLYDTVTTHSTYQNLVNGGENHIINLCESLHCTHGIIIDTYDTFASNLKTGYCLNGIEMVAGKLVNAHVWGWYYCGYRFKGADFKPANISNIELETCLASINTGQTVTPVPFEVNNSVTIEGVTVWSIGTSQALFYIKADNARVNITGLSVGNYGTVDSSLTDSTVQPTVIRIDSSRTGVFCFVEGSTLAKYTSGRILINNSSTSKAVSCVFTPNANAGTWNILKPSTVDLVKLNSM